MTKQHPGASPLGTRLDKAGKRVEELTRDVPATTEERGPGKKKKKRRTRKKKKQRPGGGAYS